MFRDYVIDQLEASGAIRSKPMFGGTGIYIDETFCAMVTRSSRFYLRVDDSNRGDFEAQGMTQFPGRGGAGMPYYEVPAAVLEDADELAQWALKAWHAAMNAKAAKAKTPAKNAKAPKSKTPAKKTPAKNAPAPKATTPDKNAKATKAKTATKKTPAMNAKAAKSKATAKKTPAKKTPAKKTPSKKAR